jgi:putative hemolysin
MQALHLGRYIAKIASNGDDIADVMALRSRVFRGGANDLDQFDTDCLHFQVCHETSGETVCAFRVLLILSGAEVDHSYSAQFYALGSLKSLNGPLAEVGRFCMHPDYNDPDVLRAAWGVLTGYVDRNGVEFLFGCSSFLGTDNDVHEPAFVLLKERYLAPEHLSPKIKASRTFPFSQRLSRHKPDLKAAMKAMPPLLRSYLTMGGWVSDHAVVDQDLKTLHVFTGLEVKSIPPLRKRILRRLAENGS